MGAILSPPPKSPSDTAHPLLGRKARYRKLVSFGHYLPPSYDPISASRIIKRSWLWLNHTLKLRNGRKRKKQTPIHHLLFDCECKTLNGNVDRPPESIYRRFKTLSAGVTFMFIINKLFDYVLYPYVIYRAQIVLGGLIMTALSAIACLALLRFYDWTKQDWIGLETIRSLRDYQGSNRMGRFLSRLISKGDLLAFIVLSLYYDPFVTTVWLRRERFSGLSGRDRRIFWGSVLICNIGWTCFCWLGVKTAFWISNII